MTTITSRQADLLADGIRQMGLALSETQQRSLLDYLALLYKWNQAYNLTAVRNPDEMVFRHLLDSLSILPHIEGDTWLDVGSGGGMPGIPMAIVFPEKRWLLLDSNGKKTRFLTHVKTTLALDNVTVEQRRAEQYHPDDVFNGIVSRAFSSLSDFCEWTRHLGDDRTRWLAMKGQYPVDELQQLPEDFRLRGEHLLTVPGCQAQRHLLILRRISTEN